MKLTDGELTVRNAVRGDEHLICAWWNDGAVMAHAGFPRGLGTNLHEVHKIFANDRAGVHELCIIERDGRPIGECHYGKTAPGTAEIGIKICDFSLHDRGLGTRLMTMLINALFGELGFTRIALNTSPENARACHVYEHKLGFTRTAVHKNSWRDQDGRPRDSVEFTLDKADWPPQPRNITLRPATLADLDELCALREEFMREFGEDAGAAYREYLERELRAGTFAQVLAVVDGAVAATGSVSYISLPPNSARPNGRVAYIANMFTRPDYRRRGLAALVLARLLEDARAAGCGDVQLNASSAGRPLYEKMGFRPVGNAMRWEGDA